MSDLIKREDAIKAIEDLPHAYNGWSDAYDKSYIIQTLEEVPSAENKGEWIESDFFGDIECSNCGAEWDCCDNDTERFNFCPNCGARMVK